MFLSNQSKLTEEEVVKDKKCIRSPPTKLDSPKRRMVEKTVILKQ